MKKFYHGSPKNHKVGSTLTSSRNSRLHFGQLERVLESYRPKTIKGSRLKSVFLVDQPTLVGLAGGDDSYIFQVKPSKPTKHHMGWFSRILHLFPGFHYDRKIHFQNESLIRQYAENYWLGKPYRYNPEIDSGWSSWEYLSSKVKIIQKSTASRCKE